MVVKVIFGVRYVGESEDNGAITREGLIMEDVDGYVPGSDVIIVLRIASDGNGDADCGAVIEW